MSEEREITEEDVKQLLTGWLTGFVDDVRWEKKNAWNNHTFSVDGRCKPDIIIRYGDKTVAIEVKMSTKSKNIYNAFPQIIKYYENVKTCHIDEKSYAITGYIVATECSLLRGRLFRREQIKTYEEMDSGRKDAAHRRELPRNEYERTEMFTRLLWRMLDYMELWREDVFIGALLSGMLDDPNARDPRILGKVGKDQFFKALI